MRIFFYWVALLSVVFPQALAWGQAATSLHTVLVTNSGTLIATARDVGVPGVAIPKVATLGIAIPGIAIPIGGALKYDNHEVWKRLVELAGGQGARFAVFATAAGDPEKSAALIIDALTRHGAVAEHIPVAPKLKTPDWPDVRRAAHDPLLVAKVKASRGIYFAGGAQERITDALYEPDGKPTPILSAIWEVFNRGGVVAGTSAGAAIMSTTMFRDPPDVLTIMQSGWNGLREGADIDRGLGFVGAHVFVDQHFLKRGRIGRMLPLMVQKGYQLGVGVDENSAVVFQGDEIEVINANGSKGALVADLEASTVDNTVPEFNLKNARLTYLDRGDRFNLKTRVVTPSRPKLSGRKVDPAAKNFSPFFADEVFYPDILGDTVIVNAMAHLIDSSQSTLTGLAFNPLAAVNPVKAGSKDVLPVQGFEFKLRKERDSLGYFTSAFGGEDYTVINIYLDITPVLMAQPLYRKR